MAGVSLARLDCLRQHGVIGACDTILRTDRKLSTDGNGVEGFEVARHIEVK